MSLADASSMRATGVFQQPARGDAVLAKDPELTVSKGVAWFSQDRAEFRFRGGSLIGRAFPTCTPELASTLGELVRVGGDREADFALELLQNYLGSTSTDSVLKEIVSRFFDDDRIMRGSDHHQ